MEKKKDSYHAAFTFGTLTQTQIWRKCSGFFRLFTTQEKGISIFGSIPWMRTSLISASLQQDSTGWLKISFPSSAPVLLPASSDETFCTSSPSSMHGSSLIKDLPPKNSGRRFFSASWRVKCFPAVQEKWKKCSLEDTESHHLFAAHEIEDSRSL